MLSKFWGYPVYLGATVILPKGYDEHPEARYPVVYAQGYLGRPAFYFTDDPSTLRQQEGLRESSNVQPGYEFFQSWTSDKFPRFLVVMFTEPSPFFPDGYGVNSANNGPYGDALTQELIPFVEKQFRAIGKPYGHRSISGFTGQEMALHFHTILWLSSPSANRLCLAST